MVQGRDRRVELGYQLAIECRKMIGLYPPKNKNSKYNPPPKEIGGPPEQVPESKEIPNENSSQQIAVVSSA